MSLETITVRVGILQKQLPVTNVMPHFSNCRTKLIVISSGFWIRILADTLKLLGKFRRIVDVRSLISSGSFSSAQP